MKYAFPVNIKISGYEEFKFEPTGMTHGGIAGTEERFTNLFSL